MLLSLASFAQPPDWCSCHQTQSGKTSSKVYQSLDWDLFPEEEFEHYKWTWYVTLQEDNLIIEFLTSVEFSTCVNCSREQWGKMRSSR